MPRDFLPANVFEASVQRLTGLYADGHRIVHSFSGGKDSLVMLECAIIAARQTNRLPVEVVMRDEEIGWPDHYEFCERTANRPEVDMTWLIANQPHSYAYDRARPFWWAFDPRVPPHRWVRQYPDWAQHISEINITVINSSLRYPPPAGKDLITTVGIRAQESRNRLLGVFSMNGWMTGRNANGSINAWPIYDWKEADVWHAIREFGFDYPKAYDDLYRAGVKRTANRMGAFLNRYATPMMPVAAKVWPKFFERLYARFPGLREGIQLGESITRPHKLETETWEQCFWRECVETAPAWIAERASKVARNTAERHILHAAAEGMPLTISDHLQCFKCGMGRGSWRELAEGLYMGDPFSEFAASGLHYMEPEQFRPELAGTPAGRWGGHPG